MSYDDVPEPAGVRVLCQGAPGGDFYHEGEPGWPMPDGMKLLCLDGAWRWFLVENGVARLDPVQDHPWPADAGKGA